MNKTKRTRRLPAGSILAIVACSMLAVGQAAAQPVKLRVADSFPNGHFIPEVATKVWMEEVTRASGQAVAFEYFQAEQLGKAKDLLALTVSGVADIGYVATTYVSDKLPLSAVAELPGSFSTACAGTAAYWQLSKEGGLLAAREFSPNSVRALFVLVMPPYDIFLNRAKFDNLKSIEGLKIRPTSGGLELVRKLKAVPVQIPAPEVYESLSRGTIDGVIFPSSSIYAYNLQGLVKSATTGGGFGTFASAYAISEKRWKTLPPNVQKAMTDASEGTMKRFCQHVDDSLSKDMEKLRQSGVTMLQLTAADKNTLADLQKESATVWAEALDKRGKPGTQVLKAFRAARPPAK